MTPQILDLPAAPRLSLDPTLRRRGVVDGAWWPNSNNAGEELPPLITELDRRLGTAVLRVGLHPDAWTHIPRRIPARGRAVRVGWFHSIDMHLVSLHTARNGDSLILLVIPPETAEAVAAIAFTLASRGERSDPPASILTASRAMPTGPAVTQTADAEAEQAWDNDGGQIIGIERERLQPWSTKSDGATVARPRSNG